MQLTRTNRPFGLTIKFTRCIKTSSQLSAFSSQLEPELKTEAVFSIRQNLGRGESKIMLTLGADQICFVRAVSYRLSALKKSNLFSCEVSSSRSFKSLLSISHESQRGAQLLKADG